MAAPHPAPLRLYVQARPYSNPDEEISTWPIIATDARKFESLLRTQLSVPDPICLAFTGNLDGDAKEVAACSVDIGDVFARVYTLRDSSLTASYPQPPLAPVVFASAGRSAYHAPRAPRASARPSVASGGGASRSAARPDDEKLTLLLLKALHKAVKASQHFLQYKGGGACVLRYVTHYLTPRHAEVYPGSATTSLPAAGFARVQFSRSTFGIPESQAPEGEAEEEAEEEADVEAAAKPVRVCCYATRARAPD